MSETLARRGARVVGVDPCAELLDVARSHALSSGFSIDYREGEGEAVPLEDASVDRVVCVDVLEHVRSLPRVLEEARRVLRPGGLFFFDTINRNWIARLLAVHVAEDALGMLPRGTHDPSRFVRPRELQRELERCGFSRLVGKFTGMGPIGINRRLDFEFGLLPCTWILYLGCAA
jgi:2-polyprenyl-6-hydroxyphenyl methylase/3-demethylubiquinone-9 3-methyltransferase